MAKWIKQKVRLKIYERDNLICCYCGKQCIIADSHKHDNRGDIASLDHIVPQRELALATTNDAEFNKARRNPANLVVACTACNDDKAHTELYVWCLTTGKNYGNILIEIGNRIQRGLNNSYVHS